MRLLLQGSRLVAVLAAVAAAVFVVLAIGEIADGQSAERANDSLSVYAEESGDGASGFSVDFDALGNINPDVVAWLRDDAGYLDNPIVQGRDNRYYLKHLFSGEQNSAGTLFVDYRIAEPFTAGHTIVYGHNMRNGTMLASVNKYQSPDHASRYPHMWLATPGTFYRVDIYAGAVINGKRDLLLLGEQGTESSEGYVNWVAGRSTYTTDVVIDDSDKIVSFVTCTSSIENGRFVLVGKLVPY